ncbi:MAG TPA: HEAT repeat domain-containing protein [Pirellulaceae bacterium]|nr:HEAT repeat domain-containing protein [Pirellulaceae bacterium]
MNDGTKHGIAIIAPGQPERNPQPGDSERRVRGAASPTASSRKMHPPSPTSTGVWALALAALASLTLAAACSRKESKLPESIRQKVQESNREAAAGRNDRRGPAVDNGATTRFTVRPFEDWTMREAVAMALSRIGSASVPALTEALVNPDAQTRQQAADTLARIGPDAAKAVPSLITALDDPDPRVRKSAAKALGQIGPAAHEAVPALMRAMQRSEVNGDHDESKPEKSQ